MLVVVISWLACVLDKHKQFLLTCNVVMAQEWQQLERDLLTVEVPVAVYFAYEDKELTEIYDDIKTAVTSDQAGSAFEGMHKYVHEACSFWGVYHLKENLTMQLKRTTVCIMIALCKITFQVN